MPPYLMDSVAIDLFAMPEVKHEVQVYEYMALCVDLQIGCIMSTPHRHKRLTAATVLKAKY